MTHRTDHNGRVMPRATLMSNPGFRKRQDQDERLAAFGREINLRVLGPIATKPRRNFGGNCVALIGLLVSVFGIVWLTALAMASV